MIKQVVVRLNWSQTVGVCAVLTLEKVWTLEQEMFVPAGSCCSAVRTCLMPFSRRGGGREGEDCSVCVMDREEGEGIAFQPASSKEQIWWIFIEASVDQKQAADNLNLPSAGGNVPPHSVCREMKQYLKTCCTTSLCSWKLQILLQHSLAAAAFLSLCSNEQQHVVKGLWTPAK